MKHVETKIATLVLSLLLALSASDARAQHGGLPVVMLWGEQVSESFSAGRFLLLSGGDTLLNCRADVRHRGATSLRYDKRSFAVKLRDLSGAARQEALLGMRKDNYWILDAAAIDMSRMRHRVAMDLWLSLGREPASFADAKAVANGSRGQYVEVIFNGQYEGIYCLSERIDRKQLGLQESGGLEVTHGLLAKAVAWSDNTCFSAKANNGADDTQARWGGFEAKYPDVEDGKPWTWQPLTSLFSFIGSSTYQSLATSIDTLIDMPVLMDYVLLVYLIEAEDNVAKNYYLAHHDTRDTAYRWFITPWDMNHSFGRRYDGEKQEAEVMNVGMLTSNVLLRRLSASPYDLKAKLYNRYEALRATHFSYDSLVSRFSRYATLLEASGAWERERERWHGNIVCPPPLAEEMQYICEWLDRRLAIVDNYFGYSSGVFLSSAFSRSGELRYYTLSGVPVSPAALRPGAVYICVGGTSSRIVRIQ